MARRLNFERYFSRLRCKSKNSISQPRWNRKAEWKSATNLALCQNHDKTTWNRKENGENRICNFSEKISRSSGGELSSKYESKKPSSFWLLGQSSGVARTSCWAPVEQAEKWLIRPTQFPQHPSHQMGDAKGLKAGQLIKSNARSHPPRSFLSSFPTAHRIFFPTTPWKLSSLTPKVRISDRRTLFLLTSFHVCLLHTAGLNAILLVILWLNSW